MKLTGEKINRSAASAKECSASKKNKKSLLPENVASLPAEKSVSHAAAIVEETGQSVAKMELLIQKQKEDLKTDAEEKELLITALHLTQELLERNIVSSVAVEAINDELTTCLAKMRGAFPEYWDYDCISVVAPPHTGESGTDSKTLQWHISNLYLDGRLIHELEFTTVLKEGIAGIIIRKMVGKNGDSKLARWPNSVGPEQDLVCIPVRGSAAQGSNRILSGLSTSDWRFLKLLIDKILKVLPTEENLEFEAAFDRVELITGLQNCKKILEQWPVILRYDAIALKRITHNPEYQSFEMVLDNMSLGDKLYQNFTYSISTIDERGGPFGQNPRLEFPESTQANFETWFAESSDQRGERLELRFALPAAIDTDVWSRLSDHDKILITALVADASSQILEISHNHAEKVARREEWVGLANAIKSILQRYTLLTLRKSDS